MLPPYTDLDAQHKSKQRNRWIAFALFLAAVVGVALGVHYSGSKSGGATPTPATPVLPACVRNDAGPWKASLEKSLRSVDGASVSGAGAVVNLHQTNVLEPRNLDDSTTYASMKKTYGIGDGVSGFWTWVEANSAAHKTELHAVFAEMRNATADKLTIGIELSLSSQIPNGEVEANTFARFLQIEDNCGKAYAIMSSGDPTKDVGGQTTDCIACTITILSATMAWA